jgi:hypothetical protein
MITRLATVPRRLLAELRDVAERTPDDRDRHVDLLRAVAITAVVVGHWMLVVVDHNGGLAGRNALAEVGWSHPLTWLFQVMPLFFLVGGYAGAASLSSHRRGGGDATRWMLGRTDRLLRPTTVLIVVLAAGALLAGAAGVDAELVGTATWLASIPLWFLVIFLVAVFLTPALHALHRRAGLAVPAGLVALVVLGDVLRLGLGVPYLGYGNVLFGWLAMYQLGFCWQDGRLPARPAVGGPLLAVGAAGLVLLTVTGPYPISMVGVPGEDLQNPMPPTVALLALATAQTGLALMLSGPANRWLRRTGPWTVVVALNAVVLTIFLWHMTAAVVAAVALVPTGILPQPPVGSAQWLLWRLPWLAVLAVLLAVLVAAAAIVELRSGSAPRGGGAPPAVLTTVGLLAVLAGLAGIAVAGPGSHGPLGLPTAAVLAYLAGAALLRLARHRART